jgi:hypothetical protein
MSDTTSETAPERVCIGCGRAEPVGVGGTCVACTSAIHAYALREEAKRWPRDAQTQDGAYVHHSLMARADQLDVEVVEESAAPRGPDDGD